MEFNGLTRVDLFCVVSLSGETVTVLLARLCEITRSWCIYIVVCDLLKVYTFYRSRDTYSSYTIKFSISSSISLFFFFVERNDFSFSNEFPMTNVDSAENRCRRARVSVDCFETLAQVIRVPPAREHSSASFARDTNEARIREGY